MSKFNYGKCPQKRQIIGILNCTPDSFFDGGRYFEPEKALAHGKQLVAEGADWIDIGGESSRPGSSPISLEEELARVMPVIEGLKGIAPLSIDTTKPEVARAALAAGVAMLNDVSGFCNPLMRKLAQTSGSLLCLMHTQAKPHYPQGVVTEIYAWFQQKIEQLIHEGIAPEQIVLDPGIGFGKTVEDNLQIIKHLDQFQSLGYPLYVGLSRKSFMQKILKVSVHEVLPTTLALGTISWLSGVCFLRVHDVKEHRAILTLLEHLDVVECVSPHD